MGTITGTFGRTGRLNPRLPGAIAGMPIEGTAGLYEAWRHHFPVGVFLDMGWTETVVLRGGGTVSSAVNVNSMVQHIINNPYVGLIPTGLNYILETNGVPRHHEETQGFTAEVEEQSNGQVYVVPSVYGWTSLASGLDPSTDYWPDAVTHNDSTAGPFAQNIVDVFTPRANVLAFNVGDDINVAAVNKRADTASFLIRQIDQRDSYGRAAVGAVVAGTAPSALAPDVKLGLVYAYPHGYYWSARTTAQGVGDNAISVEGEFWCRHNTDYPEVIRSQVDGYNADHRVPVWWVTQAHQTPFGGGGGLRYPTPREIIADCWIAVGEGIKGLFAIAWTSNFDWDGLATPAGAFRLSAYSSFSRRLTERIRRTLLGCDRAATQVFTVTGGGSTDAAVRSAYTAAYVSTLQDVVDGTRYCVVCSRATSSTPQTVTISGSGVSGGTLTNLEHGSVIALGSTVSLGPLDGSIWRYDP